MQYYLSCSTGGLYTTEVLHPPPTTLCLSHYALLTSSLYHLMGGREIIGMSSIIYANKDLVIKYKIVIIHARKNKFLLQKKINFWTKYTFQDCFIVIRLGNRRML